MHSKLNEFRLPRSLQAYDPKISCSQLQSWSCFLSFPLLFILFTTQTAQGQTYRGAPQLHWGSGRIYACRWSDNGPGRKSVRDKLTTAAGYHAEASPQALRYGLQARATAVLVGPSPHFIGSLEAVIAAVHTEEYSSGRTAAHME